jgi:predicted dehydrogenase
MTRRSNRRDFLKLSTLAGVGYWVGGSYTNAADKSPNEKLGIACVGVGGKGSSDTDQAAGIGNVVAICDIDDNHLDAKANQKDKKTGEAPFAGAKKYNDFRKMLEELDKQIDAVVVSTPDHTHAVAAMMAMKMKKHVYVQKPLTHTVYEARQMRETAKKMGICSQMGNQGTAGTSLRRAAELVQAGAIGKVSEVYVWTNRPIWPQAPGVKSRPTDMPPVPKNVHWDLFLGPSPERPYSPKYHPFAWRGWWDFGTGALGDMACHTVNLPFMALKLGYPSTVSAECDPVNPETYPGWARVTFEFPARGDMPPCKLVWHEGKKDGVLVHPPEELLKKVLVKEGQKISGSGSILVGDKGIIHSPDDYGGTVLYLPAEAKDFKAPETLPRNNGGDGGMKKEWADAIKANKPSIALSNFDYAAMLTETILLGNVAMRCAGKKLDWDGPNLKFTNESEANKFLHFEYRKGWTL